MAADEAEMEAQARALLALGCQGRAAQGRPWRTAREAVDILVHARRRAGAAGAAAHRHAQHARHRLHVFGRARRLPGARRVAGASRRGGKALRARGAARRAQSSQSGAAPGPSIICARVRAAQTLSLRACRYAMCGADASIGCEYGFAPLAGGRASATKFGNAMRWHRFRAPGGASGAAIRGAARLG